MNEAFKRNTLKLDNIDLLNFMVGYIMIGLKKQDMRVLNLKSTL